MPNVIPDQSFRSRVYNTCLGSFSVITAIPQESQADQSPAATPEEPIYCVLCTVARALKVWDDPGECELLFGEGLGSVIGPCDTAKMKNVLIDRILFLVLEGIG